jgi:FKBP12-rapamycin complex-associated protein
MGLAEKSLKLLIGSDSPLDTIIPYWSQNGQPQTSSTGRIPPQVVYAVLKYYWEYGQQANMRQTGHAERTLFCLRKFTADTAQRLDMARASMQSVPNGADPMGDYGFHNGVEPSTSHLRSQKEFQAQTVLLAKCYLRQGEWQVSLNKSDWQHPSIQDILTSYSKATQYNPKWYKAWHAWALANFEIVQAIMSPADRNAPRPDSALVTTHVVPAVTGFFKSIALSSGSSLQDTLRLLTLWFAHGGSIEVNAAVTQGFGTVSVDTWLEVIPQLIARINQPNPRVRQSIHNLLADVGRNHPQALVYPLTVAMKSTQNTRRSKSAALIMDSMRAHSAKLVEQADVVSHELIRVAVLWHEQWHEGIEEASRLW